jgi:NADPH-dependent curcumin reductase
MIPNINRRVVLASRPTGAPSPDNFRFEEQACPQVAPPGGLLLQTRWLSLDPYMRGRMNAGHSYATPAAIGEPMPGAAVCRVLASKSPDFAVGDSVVAFTGWQEVATVPAVGVVKLPADMANPSWALGVLGMPGLTAYVGLLDIGEAKAGETVVVGAATGPVGATVGQIAKLKGCRVVGIAGGSEKCELAVQTLGFDACINHYAEDRLESDLAAACPDGVDVYFENVGGKVLDAVVPLLNLRARIPLCGLVAWYNQTSDAVASGLPSLMTRALIHRIRIQGFIVGDHLDRRADFLKDMQSWIAEGAIRYQEDVVEGLSRAPMAFMGLLRGDNFGKLVIKVAD